MRRAFFFSILATPLLALAACGDSSSPTTGTGGSTATSTTSGSGGSGGGTTGQGGSGGSGGAAPAQVMVMFEARVGDKPFKCADTYDGLGTAATSAKLTDFRLYLHDVMLHQKGGADVPVTLTQDGLWQYQGLALLDFEDKSGACANGTAETNMMVMGTAPAGPYDGVSFKLGVPFALDHADVATAPSPLNLSELFWNWNDGYKFLRIDASPVGLGPFLFHLGSTACMGDFANGGVTGCDRPNVAQVSLSGFDPDKNVIAVDYAALVAGSDLSKNEGGPPGCMSGAADPECAALFTRIGIDMADGSLHPDQQKLFRIE